MGLYANTFENLKEMDNSLRKYRIPKLIEVESLNRPISVEENKKLIVKLLLKKSTRGLPWWCSG